MARLCVMKEEIDQINYLLSLQSEFGRLENFRDRYSNGVVSIIVDGNCGRAAYRAETADHGAPKHPAGFKEQVQYEIGKIIGAATKQAIRDVLKLIKEKMPFDVQS